MLACIQRGFGFSGIPSISDAKSNDGSFESEMPALSDNSSPSARLLVDNAEAERRLREAEDRLREAMDELHRRQRTAACGDSPPCDHADDSCVANAIGNLCQSFLLSYGVRVGIGILLRGF
ncbi:hypothetical protein V6N13_115505 [Hibiscus sabdariffa]